MTSKNKQLTLRVFMMEVTERVNNTKSLFSETIHMLDKPEQHYDEYSLEFKLKTMAISLIHHKKNHSFLRTVQGIDWIVNMCLVDTKLFSNRELLDSYIKDNKIKNGPLFGTSYNNFVF